LPKRIDTFDWADTPLGPMDGWPTALRTAYDIMMGTGFATCAIWGPEQTLIFNAAYIPFLGARHPGALGRPIHEVWHDVWPDIQPLVAEALAGGTVYQENMHLVMTRNGYPEDTWWTFSYSPLRDGERVAGMLDIAVETTARMKAEQSRTLVVSEVTHRLKNTLSLVQALARQTLRPVTEQTAVRDFEERLHALGSAHDVLLRHDWDVAELGLLIDAALERLAERPRYALSGDVLKVSGRVAQNVSLLIHELATNARKHGALSHPEGRVAVRWWLDGTDVRLEWLERGGPPAAPPTRQGFGSRLIARGLTGAGGVEMLYEAEGLTVRMRSSAQTLLEP
jgi:two-component sensor histidine kinase